MNIMLGNLQINQMEERMGIKFPEDCVEYMKQHYCSSAEVTKGDYWHCFDIPFVMVCGSMNTAQTIYDYIKPLASEIKNPLQISIQK